MQFLLKLGYTPDLMIAAANVLLRAWPSPARGGRISLARCRACSDGGASRQTGLWQGRQGKLACRSCTTPASGLSGAQCQGLVGPKMPMVGVPIAAATCSRPELFDIASSAAASARMALRRSVPGEVAHAPDCLGGDFAAPGPSRRGRRPPRPRRPRGRSCAASVGKVRGRPALRGADRAGGQRDDRARLAARPRRRARPRLSVAGTISSGSGHSAGSAAPLGKRQRGACVDHAGQFALAAAHVVEQAEPAFADKAGAHRNAGQERRQRRFPGARHHQRLRVAFLPQLVGRGAVLSGKREPAARQVADDPLPHARHVIEQAARRATSPGRRPAGRARCDFSSFTTEWQRTKSPIHI